MDSSRKAVVWLVYHWWHWERVEWSLPNVVVSIGHIHVLLRVLANHVEWILH